ncbi:hypothetical protein [Bdellovibrio bacteriovorus]|uniref:hypothetical protein n=1 Tax=Bdellovibrio TaxID=958 RepID=UPI0035A8D233
MMAFLRSALLIGLFIGSQASAREWSDYVKSVSARVVPESTEARLIEATYFQILGTSAGTHVCFIVKGDVEVLGHLIGVAESGREKLNQLCEQQIQNRVGSTIQFKMRGHKERLLQRPGKAYYIVPESTRFPYDSWTDLENRTYISSTALREGRLTRVLIHELQIALDDRDNLLNNWDHQNDWLVSDRREMRSVLGSVYESPMRKIFAVMRAFNYEDAVLNNVQMLNNPECLQVAESVIQGMEKNYSAKERALLYAAWNQVRSTGLSFSLNPAYILPDTEHTTSYRKELSLCQFMSLPFVVATDHLSDGPRPRIVPPVGNGGFVIDKKNEIIIEQIRRNQTVNGLLLKKKLDLKGDSDAIPSVEPTKD